MTRRVAPSILAADFARLGEQVREVVDAGATIIHVDVMDGHFVPPISMGPLVVSALRSKFDVTLDVHLMVAKPESQVADFAKAGADNITFHAEATPHRDYLVNAIREAGCKAGVAICPSTPTLVYSEIEVDIALCMTVNPGWGGQPFIPRSIDKLRRLRELVGEDVDIEVDGGIGAETAGPCAEAGATLFVAGNSIFGTPDPAEAYTRIANIVG